MNLISVLGGIVAAVMFFFALIFAFATYYWPTGLAVSAILFIAAFALIYFVTKKPTTITQRLEVSGEMKTVGLKCPNCGGAVDPKQIKIVSGVPYATCSYCGHMFEVAEEPKW